MNFKNLLIIFITTAVALVSCNKGNGDPEPEPQPSGAILPSVMTYFKSASAMPDADMITRVVKFEYDILDRITKCHSESFINGNSNGVISTLTFTYTDNINNFTTVVTRTDVPGDEFGRSDYYMRGSEIIAHGNENAPIKLNEASRALNYRSFDNRTDYEFTYDSNGNTTSITTKDLSTASIEKYESLPGQSNGIFRNVKTPAWYITSQMGRGSMDGEGWPFNFGDISYQQLTNNCIRSTEVDGETIYEYNYEFNADNYPTQIIQNPNFTGGEYVRYDIEYIKAE